MKALRTLLSASILTFDGVAGVSAQTHETDASIHPPVRISWQQAAVRDEAQRRLEVFAQIGRMDASDSSGPLGTMSPVGGSVAVVLMDGLVLEADFQTGQVTKRGEFEETTLTWRRSQVGVTVLRRQRVFDPVTVFFGGGAGIQLDRLHRDGRFLGERDHLAGHGRGGLLIRLPGRWLLRSELGLWLVPNAPLFTVGLRIGVGVRL